MDKLTVWQQELLEEEPLLWKLKEKPEIAVEIWGVPGFNKHSTQAKINVYNVACKAERLAIGNIIHDINKSHAHLDANWSVKIRLLNNYVKPAAWTANENVYDYNVFMQGKISTLEGTLQAAYILFTRLEA